MKPIAYALTAFLGLITIGIGGMYFTLGPGFLVLGGGFDFGPIAGTPAYAAVDSSLRFFAGLWLAMGLCLFYCLGDFANRTTMLRLMMLGFFLGGIGRLISMAQFGVLEPMIVPTLIELVIPPIVVVLQSRMARSEITANA
ncbi:MAG: DUF4345 domain-containing protein [Pseudomonadota bacterium]